MENNILKSDLEKVITFLKKKNLILTQSKNVELFEKKWSNWLGTKYSVFVNSGSSANLISIATLKEKYGSNWEIIVPSFTWVSDISLGIVHALLLPSKPIKREHSIGVSLLGRLFFC